MSIHCVFLYGSFSSGTNRMVNWCGCIIQDPHSAVRALGFLPEDGHGVYVAR